MALICKKWYEYAVSQELENDAYNIVEDEDLNDILARHKEWNEKYKYNHYNILPYLYGSPKMQKDPLNCGLLQGYLQINLALQATQMMILILFIGDLLIQRVVPQQQHPRP